MRRTGKLFEAILARENLRLAFSNALRGKRDRPDAQAFARNLDRNLQEMALQLKSANRNRNSPDNRNNNLGFRVAFSLIY